MSDVPMTSGPARTVTVEERAEQVSKVQSALWSAIWEASNVMPLGDIDVFCARVLEEIRSDAE